MASTHTVKPRTSWAIFVPGPPPTVTAQTREVAVRGGKPVFYKPPRLLEAEAYLRDALLPHAPESPFTGALRLVTKWCFPLSPGHRDGQYKTTRPDTDNLQKLLKDVMTRCGFWRDDSQVASEIIEKFWAEEPGIYIEISVI